MNKLMETPIIEFLELTRSAAKEKGEKMSCTKLITQFSNPAKFQEDLTIGDVIADIFCMIERLKNNHRGVGNNSCLLLASTLAAAAYISGKTLQSDKEKEDAHAAALVECNKEPQSLIAKALDDYDKLQEQDDTDIVIRSRNKQTVIITSDKTDMTIKKRGGHTSEVSVTLSDNDA